MNLSDQIEPIVGSLNRVIILPDEVAEKTKGGIYIPDVAKEKPQRGVVMAVSSVDHEGQKPTVKVDDIVLYSKYGTTSFPYGDIECLIMRENDIFAREIPKPLPKEKKTK